MAHLHLHLCLTPVFSRLARMNYPEWGYAVLGFIASAAAGSLSPAFSFLFSSLIIVFYNTDTNVMKANASFYAGMMALCGFGGFLAMLVQQVSFGTMGQYLSLRVRELLFGVRMKATRDVVSYTEAIAVAEAHLYHYSLMIHHASYLENSPHLLIPCGAFLSGHPPPRDRLV